METSKRTIGYMLATIVLTVAVSIAFTSAQNADLPQPQGLDDGRRWFESRALLTPTSPALLRGAAASAFNEVATAETLLRDVIRSQPQSDAASQAHELLSRIYLRSGQYKRLIKNLDAWAKASPERKEVKSERADIEQFRGLPDQINGPRRVSTLRHGGDIFVPVSINGKLATYFFDTGAWVSVMTQAEAARLGLEIHEGQGTLSDSSGRGARIRTAVARELTLGSMLFRNVSFAILPNQAPWSGLPGQGGILGMPILLGVGTIRWSKDGKVEFGGSIGQPERSDSNLVFYRNRLLLRTSVLGNPVFTTLDTGAVATDLNSNFATQFAEMVQQTGTKDTKDITGVGGTTSVEAIRLPEVVFQIGATTATLRPATVTLQRTAAIGGDCCVANVGLDLLTQGRGFTIDFSTMTLRLD